ncbi:UNVERIFIED_ORG: hypothetical protein M2215_008446 [Bradyrhizobium japonicum]
MARAPIPSIQEAPTKSQPILENYVKVLGVVPNFFSLISQSPDALKAIADMHARRSARASATRPANACTS